MPSFGPIQWFDWDAVTREDGKHLPHFLQRDAACFITFRLWDSIPAGTLNQLKARRDTWLAINPEPHTPDQQQELKRIYSVPLECYLDAGRGCCLLRNPACRALLEAILLRFDGDRYRLGDYVIMPNHVHLILQTHTHTDMTQLCWRWKNLSATQINRLLGRRGHLWQSEAFDHILRGPEQLARCRRYIRLNPAKLPPTDYTLACGSLFPGPASGPTPAGSASPAQQPLVRQPHSASFQPSAAQCA